MTSSILSSLLSAEQLTVFNETWPEQCLVQHGNRERLPELFLNPILASLNALTASYTGLTMEADRSTSFDMVPVDTGANQVVAKGLTAYLGDIVAVLPGASEFLAALEQELGVPEGCARIGAFLSPAGNGAPQHYDGEDVISIQLVGHKRFYTAPVTQIKFPYGHQYNASTFPTDDLYPQLMQGVPESSEQEFEQFDMRPGSVLCMPRGFWHHTVADEDSLAVSIIFNPPTEIDELLGQLKSTLLQDPAWRRPCYNRAGLANHSTNLMQRLPSIVNTLIYRNADPNSPSRRFHQKSRFMRVPGASVEIKPGDAYSELYISAMQEDGARHTAKMNIPTQAAEVFLWLGNRSIPFTTRKLLKSFPALSLNEVTPLLEAATNIGLIRFLWFDPIR